MMRSKQRKFSAFLLAGIFAASAASFSGFTVKAALEQNNGQIFHDIRLMGADLTDELVYSWLKTPPLSGQHNIVLTEISAPVGLDQRFANVIENRLYDLLQANPGLQLTLTHCSACLQYAVVARPTQTVLSRAIDQPEVIANLLKAAPNQLGLSLNFEATGRTLTLRAQIFEIAPPQKVVWARAFNSSLDSREVLRDASPLISIDEAREQQRQLLRGHESLSTNTRFEIRNFAGEGDLKTLPPLVFLSQSLEASLSPRKNRKFALEVGFTSIKSSLQGWSVGGHFSQLLGRSQPSLMEPDVYAFIGATYMSLQGPGAAPFASDILDVRTIINAQDEPVAGMTLLRAGFEALVKYRFGLDLYIEYIPVLSKSEIIKTQKSLLIPFHDFGLSLVVQW